MSASRIVVAGGGPVGLALASCLQGFDVQVIEASAAREASAPDEFEARVFAVSPGTRTMLRDLGAWDGLDARRVAAVRRMEITGDGGAKLSFSARPGAALAWIVEAGRLSHALEAHAAAQPAVEIVRGVQAIRFHAAADAASVELADGRVLAGDLLVGADGPDSAVRSALAVPFREQPYGEFGVVANFECERPHGDVARQWFRSDGVLAWLPLPGSRISIVWSTASANAEALAALPQPELEARVAEAGASVLGHLRLVSPVMRFPLRLIDVPDPVVPGAALIGDAAHGVHPLAGQGVNLGFQDVRALSSVLADRGALERPGDLAVLRRYARARREDVTAMQFVTDRLDRLFASGKPGAFSLRNWGLQLVDSQEWAKDALAGRAMR
ncbi:MAG TPA: FAD-dependent monooxygenase [Usitatibacter sp.]|jgi:2-octaprenyl-6-methoxyphenol hydroxylase|nr:FAD-dependent monooxygenase [Usitatibacter sp.]